MREYKTGMTPTSEERVAFNVTYETFYDTYGNVYGTYGNVYEH